MPTPYEEMSNLRASSANVRTDANLALDSLLLGGIEAEEYATKVYVQQITNHIKGLCNTYTDEKVLAALEAAKSYTDTVVRNIDYSRFATKADLTAAIENSISECKSYIDTQITNLDINSYETKADHNQDMASLNEYINETFQILFQSVSNGKKLVADAITDKGVNTSASSTFSTMAANIRAIPQQGGGGGGGIDTSDATAYASNILKGYTAYARGEKLIGTYVPESVNVNTGGEGDNDVELIYGKAPSSPTNILSGYSPIITSENGQSVVYQDNTIYVNKVDGREKVYYEGRLVEVKNAYTFEELGISGTFKGMAYNRKGNLLGILTNTNVYIFRIYSSVEKVDDDYVYIPIKDLTTTRVVYTSTSGDVEEQTIFTRNKWSSGVSKRGGIQNIDRASIIWSTTDDNLFVVGMTGVIGSGYQRGGINLYRIKSDEEITESSPSTIIEKGAKDLTENMHYFEFLNAQLSNNVILYTYWRENLVYNRNYYAGLITIDKSEPFVEKDHALDSVSLSSGNYEAVTLTTDGTMIISPDGKVKNIVVDASYNASLVDEGKTLGVTSFGYIRFNSTNEYALLHKDSKSDLYEVDFSGSTILTERVSQQETINTGFTSGRKSIIISENQRQIIKFESNYNVLLAIEYKGDTYVKIAAGKYSAKPADVTEGKTFIGYSGRAEVGTLGGDTSE